MDAKDLEALFKLKEKGIITEEEFEAKKREFLQGSVGGNAKNSLGIIDNYIYCVQNSFNMKDRATRSEFWYFFFYICISFFYCFTMKFFFHLFCSSFFPSFAPWKYRVNTPSSNTYP